MDKILAYHRVSNINPSKQSKSRIFGGNPEHEKIPVFVGGDALFGDIEVLRVSHLGSAEITICNKKTGGVPPTPALIFGMI